MKEINSLKDLKTIVNSSYGKKFVELDVNKRLNNKFNKGRLGQIVEEGLFEKKLDSGRNPDFEKLGVELKVTPFIKHSRGFSSKERLVISMINYMKDYNLDFSESHCFNKMKLMQLLFYEHIFGKEYQDLTIGPGYLFNYDEIPLEDKLIIEQDYKKIMNKIINGNAHEISESDTMYLSACTKSKNSSVLVKQPFSEVLAKPRAFALKQSYMTNILKKTLKKRDKSQSLASTAELNVKSFEQILVSKFDIFKGMSITQIENNLGIHVNRNAKGYLRSLTSKMLGLTSNNPEAVSEFKKSGIIVKTIRVNKKGRIKESMSLPSFRFKELMLEDWETSTLRNYFTQKKFLLVVFNEVDDKKREYKFNKVILWTAKDVLIDQDFKLVWDKTRDVVSEGVEFTRTKKGLKNNLPKSKFSNVMHVRPHGENADDVDILPNGDRITKQCFWISNKYVEIIIESF